MAKASAKISQGIWTAVIFVVVLVFVAVYLYFDQHDELSSVLRSLGLVGVLIAIVVMAALNVTPVPSEGLLIVYLKIFGPWWGVFYGWIGAVLSSFVVFEVARRVARPMLRNLITPKRLEQVDHWIKKSGTLGLLMVRLLPMPGFVVSYIVGLIPSVRMWAFVWTAAVAIIPYYVGVALIFVGVSHHIITWLSIGLSAMVVVWAIGWFVKSKSAHEHTRF